MAAMSIEQAMAALQQLQTAAPAASTSPYFQAKTEFAGIPRNKTDQRMEAVLGAVGGVFSTFGADAPPAPKGEKEDYVVSATGKIMYANGTIYDPETQSLLTPPGKAVPGSREWLLKIQEEWPDAEANRWRKKLAKQGYQVAETGGMGWDLLEALPEFHTRRYANFGKVQPLIPGTGQEAPDVEGAIDKVALRQEIKTWGQVPFGEDLADEEADWFTDRIIKVASRLARKKGWTPDQALAGAQARVMEDFTKKPQVAALIQEQEDQEVSYKIRDSVLGVSQLLGA